MDLQIPTNFEEIKFHLKDPLYKNSFYLILTSVLGSVFGFIFWIFAANIYTSEIVGITSALISAINLIVLIAFLGLNQSLIRFFPEKDKNKVFGTSIYIVTISTLLFGILFLLGINIWSPKLNIINEIPLIFLFSLLMYSLTIFTGNVFIALRKTKFYFIQSLLTGFRIILLVIFLSSGFLGVFLSFSLPYVFIFILSIYLILNLGINFDKIDGQFLRESFSFSIANYISGVLALSPTYILPILVLNVLGANEAAYFYISFAIASLLFTIPLSISTSLFVEGSYGEKLRKNTLKSIFLSFVLLIPAIVFLIVFGKFLLGFIGNDYVTGYDLLITISLSSLFTTIYYIYISIKKVHKDVKRLIFINAVYSVLILGLSYSFMLEWGLIGVGYSYLIGTGLTSLIIGIFVKKEFI